MFSLGWGGIGQLGMGFQSPGSVGAAFQFSSVVLLPFYTFVGTCAETGPPPGPLLGVGGEDILRSAICPVSYPPGCINRTDLGARSHQERE